MQILVLKNLADLKIKCCLLTETKKNKKQDGL